jgi:hypothetical protein
MSNALNLSQSAGVCGQSTDSADNLRTEIDRDDLINLRDHLIKQRTELNRRIRFVSQQIGKARYHKFLNLKQGAEIAARILRGAGISEVALDYGISVQATRNHLHRFCQNRNSAVYKSFKEWHGGTYRNYDTPPLEYLREYAETFLTTPGA